MEECPYCGWWVKSNSLSVIADAMASHKRGCKGKPVERSMDLLKDGSSRYEHCDECNYQRHICSGCGADLTHSGHEFKETEGWVLHGTSCFD